MNVGRLVIPALRWRSETGFDHEAAAIDQALAAGAGGFIVFGGPAPVVGGLVEGIRRRAAGPLVFGADLERGAGQQFAGLRELPPPAALASLGDLEAIAAAGRTTAVDAASVGVDWLYAPVADLDVEPENPIVQTRAFGADPALVAAAVAAWIRGARSAGGLTCAKHYPGHGRTTRDSHDQLGTVAASEALLEATDLVPFRAAIAAGVHSMMTCHVGFPALDPSGKPATLSPLLLGRLRKMGFTGLIVSDALIMEGIKAPDASVPVIAAIEAGVDVLLYPPDPVGAIAAITARARSDDRFATIVRASLERLDRMLASRRVGSGGEVDPAALADRILARAAPAVRLRAPVDLVIADDDLDGAFPATSSDYLRQGLIGLGIPVGAGGSRILVTMAEPRASKGRGGLGERTRAIIAGAADLDLAIAFTNARWTSCLPAGVPVLLGWHRQRLMQEAAARWIAEQIR